MKVSSKPEITAPNGAAEWRSRMAQPNGAAEWRSRMAKTCLMVFLCNLFTFKAMYAQEQHSFSCGTPYNTADNLVLDREMLAKIATVSPPCGGDSIFHIRTAIHYFLREDGTGNFNEFDDGRTNDPIPSGEPANYHQLWNGYRFAATITAAANARLLQNVQLQSLHSSCTFTPPAVYPIKILYTLTGVYFHRVQPTTYDAIHADACVAQNVLASYAVNSSNTLNIVLGAFAYADGCAASIPAPVNGMRFSCENQWNMYTATNHWDNIIWGTGNWSTPTMNHELGHLLYLIHTFEGDGLADTPPCGKGHTNNIMDYGMNQDALTPDQLNKMYATLKSTIPGTGHIPAYKYQCNPCSPAYSFSKVHEKCTEVYLAGGWYGTWTEPYNQFIEIFETNGTGSNTVVGNYYSSWFNNVGGEAYLRNLSKSPINYNFQPGKIYKIKMAVQNTTCTSWHESSNWITYSGAINQQQCGGNNNGGERIAQLENKVQIYPNPANNELNFVLPEIPKNPVQVVVTDITGKTVQNIMLQNTYTRRNIELPNGIYLIRIPELNHIQKIIIQ